MSPGNLEEARKMAEEYTGRKMSDEQFYEAVAYAGHKLFLNDDLRSIGCFPAMVFDSAKNLLWQDGINEFTAEAMETGRIVLQELIRRSA